MSEGMNTALNQHAAHGCSPSCLWQRHHSRIATENSKRKRERHAMRTLLMYLIATQHLVLLPVSSFQLGRRGFTSSLPFKGSESSYFSSKKIRRHHWGIKHGTDLMMTSDADMTGKESHPQPMKGRVCIVTGASRGIGKGIAVELGRAGATVYVTGTSTKNSNSTPDTCSSTSEKYATNDDVGGPGTIEETASLVTHSGGLGIPVLCNHANDTAVENLFHRVRQEQGRLDVLVNNAFRVSEGGADALMGNFWEQGPRAWDSLHTVGLRSHYVASCLAVPLMMENPKLMRKNEGEEPPPLIAMISSFGGIVYTFNVAYGVGKAGVDRLAKDMAVELDKHGICTCSLYPGVVYTERMGKVVDSGEWEEKMGISLEDAETPGYTGRAVVALATDKSSMTKSGSVQVVAELAREYGFYDKIEKEETRWQPPSIRSLKFLVPNYALTKEQRKLVPDWMIPDWKLPMWVMAGGRPEKDSRV